MDSGKSFARGIVRSGPNIQRAARSLAVVLVPAARGIDLPPHSLLCSGLTTDMQAGSGGEGGTISSPLPILRLNGDIEANARADLSRGLRAIPGQAHYPGFPIWLHKWYSRTLYVS